MTGRATTRAGAPDAGLGTDAAPASAADFYPETVSPLRAQLPVMNAEFAELREAYLLGFGQRTATAYWGDLEQLHDWCQDQRVDVLRPRPSDLQTFLNDQSEHG